jgi:hypothetical protein
LATATLSQVVGNRDFISQQALAGLFLALAAIPPQSPIPSGFPPRPIGHRSDRGVAHPLNLLNGRTSVQ